MFMFDLKKEKRKIKMNLFVFLLFESFRLIFHLHLDMNIHLIMQVSAPDVISNFTLHFNVSIVDGCMKFVAQAPFQNVEFRMITDQKAIAHHFQIFQQANN